ncbi:MAG: TVP38/TMEM64 family protein [Candidatus Helarchaeota archaeon]
MSGNETEPPKNGFGAKLKKLLHVSQYDTKTILYLALFLFVIILMLGIYAYNYLIDDTFLPRLVLEWFIIPLRENLILGVFIFFGLMVLQSLIAPIPSEMVLLASGLVWGLAGGAAVGFVGSMISAFIGFYIAKRGGRPLAVGIIGEDATQSMEYYMTKYGSVLIVGMRALPTVPYDLFTLIGGFTQMDLKRYTIATGIGTVPRVIFYSWAGTLMASNVNEFITLLQTDPTAWESFESIAYVKDFNFWMLIIIGTVLIGFAIFYFVVFPYMKKGYAREKEKEASASSSPPSEISNFLKRYFCIIRLPFFPSYKRWTIFPRSFPPFD